ncbi:hypothetical protein [Actinomadura sp. WMMA1423]|uniref:hypothetical protein n=1 Tax=Actinomadura sp. WMMA1423 TaxID=2591108 RepID=UPI001146C98F|nr:hypothetical protein [Actinomadura sp. WMMA1423]
MTAASGPRTVQAPAPAGPASSEVEVRFVAFGWYLLTACLSVAVLLTAVLSGWRGGDYWAAPIGAIVLAVGAAASRRLRLRRDQWLTPGNLVLVVWYLELVALPTLIVVRPPVPGLMRVLPPVPAINYAMCVQSLAFASFAVCFAVRAGAGRSARAASGARAEGPAGARRPVPVPVVLAFLAVGTAGMALFFRTPGEAWAYYTGHPALLEPGSRTSLGQGISALTRPFLGVGGLLWLQRGLASRPPGAAAPSRRRTTWRAVVALALLFLSYSSYHYNRQAAVTALIALLAVCSLQVRRLNLPVLLVTFVFVGVCSSYVGTYRLFYVETRGGELSAREVGLDDYRADPLEELERYLGAPQFVAIAVEGNGGGAPLLGPESLLASVLRPVPIIGKPYRDTDTGKVYNERIYGSLVAHDQHPPLVVDLLFAGGPSGVVAGFSLLGIAFGALDRRYRPTADTLDAYLHVFTSITLAFSVAGGIAVLSQTLLYFCLPPYLARAFFRGARKGPAGKAVPALDAGVIGR